MIHLFFDDYSEGAHPALLTAIADSNDAQQSGYGNDEHCANAAELIKDRFGVPGADVHFVSGATQANFIGLSSMLRSYQGVIAPDSGHISVHEAGAVEATGHKIINVGHDEGKISPASIDAALATHEDEHTVMPRALYFTQATELGTVYSRAEVEALVAKAKHHDLYTYMDGARLAMALASDDSQLSVADIGQLDIDMFSVGGTKVGGMFGEALVIVNDELKADFRYQMKQRGALLAKSRFIGVQFERFFADDDLWLQLGRRSNESAMTIANSLQKLDVEFAHEPQTNQLFVILPAAVVRKLQENYGFYVWKPLDNDTELIRIVCSWATPESAVDQFSNEVERLLG